MYYVTFKADLTFTELYAVSEANETRSSCETWNCKGCRGWKFKIKKATAR